MAYLVMLEAVQQDVQVKGRNIVANQDIWIQVVQAPNKVAQQGTLAGLDRQHVAAIAAPQLALIAVFHSLLKACNSILLADFSTYPNPEGAPAMCSVRFRGTEHLKRAGVY